MSLVSLWFGAEIQKRKVESAYSFKANDTTQWTYHFVSFRSRAFASGLVAAVNYMLAFAATKTYYDLETFLSLPGVILFYGIIGIFGYVAMYYTLPETEQRSLEDIERHFSDNSRSITDIHIKIHSTQSLRDDSHESANSSKTDQWNAGQLTLINHMHWYSISPITSAKYDQLATASPMASRSPQKLNDEYLFGSEFWNAMSRHISN